MIITGNGYSVLLFYLDYRKSLSQKSRREIIKYSSRPVQFSFQIFNAARQVSHTEAAPDKSGLILLDYWVGLKRCLVIIHN